MLLINFIEHGGMFESVLHGYNDKPEGLYTRGLNVVLEDEFGKISK